MSNKRTIAAVTLVLSMLLMVLVLYTTKTGKLGPLVLAPPVLAIVLAFATRNVVVSLLIGLFSGSFLTAFSQEGRLLEAPMTAFSDLTQRMLSVTADPWNAGILLQVLTIGGLIALIARMGGARAIAEFLARKAKSPASAQITAWLIGLLVFFDDYANALIAGPVMRPVTDKLKISREKLAFIIDATAAPIAGIAFISTWIGYELSLIKDSFAAIGQHVSAFDIFLQTIPYRFYNILMLLFVPLTAILAREFGPMLSAERRARRGQVHLNGETSSSCEMPQGFWGEQKTTPRALNAVIPIGVLVAAALIGFYINGFAAIMAGSNAQLKSLLELSPYSLTAIREAFGAADASVVLFQAALLASLMAALLAVGQRILTLGQAVDTWIEGAKSLAITGVILILAWSLSSVVRDLGTADYLVGLLSETMPAFLLPSLIFILGSLISFATGTSYGTMGVLMPLAVPLAHALAPADSQLALVSVGAVLTGAVLGDHCSPISDTTILSSMGASCDHIEHTRTQLGYAVLVGAISLLCGYLPVGYGMPAWAALLLGVVVMAVSLRLIGRPVDTGLMPANSEAGAGYPEVAAE